MSGELLNIIGINRIYILGAGFSGSLGMPLGNSLLGHIYDIAIRKEWTTDNGLEPKGQAEWLLDELRFHFPAEEFSHAKILQLRESLDFDIELFLSYVAVSSACGEQWNEEGGKFLAFLKGWIGEAIFCSQIRAMSNELPAHFQKFFESLTASMILTFNWDTIVEQNLDRLRRPYVFDIDYHAVKAGALPIIKMHGSIDWFSSESTKPPFKNLEDIVFSPVSESAEGIVRANGSVLNCYDSYLHPRLVVPSYDKINQVMNLGEIWKYPWTLFRGDLEIVVIGFSMRPDDFHTRAIIYPQLVQGSRNGNLQVKVVDLAKDDAQKKAITDRYKCVDGCKFWFDGFDEDVWSFIEA